VSVRRGSDPGVDQIRAAREGTGPVPRKGVGPVAWFDIRKRGLGHFAFSLNRFTGLGLVFYLYLHLAVLSMLFLGEEAWDDFLGLATTKLFLLLDVLLIFGLLAHGLNGLRLALIGSGRGIDRRPEQAGVGHRIGGPEAGVEARPQGRGLLLRAALGLRQPGHAGGEHLVVAEPRVDLRRGPHRRGCDR
jgi:succinate dehydrogenase / fumarate reductase cytochrome b subunit